MTPSSEPLTPDEIEQRQQPDGTVDPDVAEEVEGGAEPLTPDEIEQRQVVPTDDEEEPWDDRGDDLA